MELERIVMFIFLQLEPKYLNMKSIYNCLIIVFFLLPNILHAQNEMEYQKQAYEFLNQIRFTRFFRDTTDVLVVRDHLSNNGLFQGIALANKPFFRKFLTDFELLELAKQFYDDTSKLYLKENGIKKSRIISDSVIRELDNLSYRDQVCTYWKLSKPCFVRNFTICTFSYAFCDAQSTVLYKKLNDKWIYVSEIGGIRNDY